MAVWDTINLLHLQIGLTRFEKKQPSNKTGYLSNKLQISETKQGTGLHRMI